MPADEADIRQRLKALSQDITSHHADLLKLLVRFDELQGWKSGGASHCAEPIDIGRKSRIWPNAMARAIKDRDQHCQWPGCCHTRNLQVHHIHHWADGGSTSVENGACVCQFHHTMVHEGGYSIQRINDNERYADELFILQQRANDASMFSFEKDIRNDREAFNQTRQLRPTRYRFRVVDAEGRDVRECRSASTDNSHLSSAGNDVCHENHGDQAIVKDDLQYPAASHHSTRMECNEPIPSTYPCSVRPSHYGHRIREAYQDHHFDSKGQAFWTHIMTHLFTIQLEKR